MRSYEGTIRIRRCRNSSKGTRYFYSEERLSAGVFLVSLKRLVYEIDDSCGNVLGEKDVEAISLSLQLLRRTERALYAVARPHQRTDDTNYLDGHCRNVRLVRHRATKATILT